MLLYKNKIENFLKQKEIILSTIIFLISIFFWDIKINYIIQSKFLIIFLVIYFFLNFKKSESLKFLIINLLIVFLLFLHSIYFVNYNIGNYFIFSLLFFFISNCIAYNLNINFELILKKSCLYFILIFNLIFCYDVIFSDFYVYDHINQHNGMCIIFHTEDKLLLNFFFIENSHVAMTATSIIIYLFLNFPKLSNFYKINFIFFISSILLFLGSLTLYLGLFLSIIFISPYLFKKNKSKSIIILLFINLLIIFSFNNCKLRILQIFESDNLFLKEDNVVSEINEFLDFIPKKLDSISKKLDPISKKLDRISKKEIKKELSEDTNFRAFDADGNVKYGINVSTVVYVNHLNFVVDNFEKHIFGIGFQNYESYAIEHAKKDHLIENYKTQALINISDGASNLNKLIVEFGILNIIFVFLFFYCLLKNNYSFEVNCFIFTLVLTQSMRGAGYFNGGFIFIIVILISSVFSKKSNNTSTSV